MHWFDRAQKELDEDYEAGLLSSKEYNQACRELDQELDECAREVAQQAYDSYY